MTNHLNYLMVLFPISSIFLAGCITENQIEDNNYSCENYQLYDILLPSNGTFNEKYLTESDLFSLSYNDNNSYNKTYNSGCLGRDTLLIKNFTSERISSKDYILTNATILINFRIIDLMVFESMVNNSDLTIKWSMNGSSNRFEFIPYNDSGEYELHNIELFNNKSYEKEFLFNSITIQLERYIIPFSYAKSIIEIDSLVLKVGHYSRENNYVNGD